MWWTLSPFKKKIHKIYHTLNTCTSIQNNIYIIEYNMPVWINNNSNNKMTIHEPTSQLSNPVTSLNPSMWPSLSLLPTQAVATGLNAPSLIALSFLLLSHIYVCPKGIQHLVLSGLEIFLCGITMYFFFSGLLVLLIT